MWAHVITPVENWLTRLQDDPNFLDEFVIGDETWLYQYDPKTKCQNVEWLTPLDFHHDAPSHTELVAAETLAKFNVSMKPFVTGDMTWLYQYDPETECQNVAWHAPLNFYHDNDLSHKSLAIAAEILAKFNLAMKPFVTRDEASFYQFDPETKHQNVELRIPLDFHHDDAPSYTSLVATEIFAKFNVEKKSNTGVVRTSNCGTTGRECNSRLGTIH